jgi:protein-tyrosine phosphatase
MMIMKGRGFIWALLCAGVVCTLNAGGQEGKPAPERQVLFVCTGNYYRSRFAEALFNEKASEAHLGWRAVSRGLKLVASQRGISSLARRELMKRGVPKELCAGDPKGLTKEDLEKSDYIVFMDEAEHRPMLEKEFPGRDERKIHYWHIAETWKMSPAKACQTMAGDIDELLRTLGR